MEIEAANQIHPAEIPGDLKITLAGYLQAFEELKPSLPQVNQLCFTYWLDQLLKEAIDPSVEAHW